MIFEDHGVGVDEGFAGFAGWAVDARLSEEKEVLGESDYVSFCDAFAT